MPPRDAAAAFAATESALTPMRRADCIGGSILREVESVRNLQVGLALPGGILRS